MTTWLDLEKRFNELQPRLGGRLDSQTGSSGEHRHVTAYHDVSAAAEFRSLAQIAGHKLLQSGYAGDEVRDPPSSEYAWYRLISSDLRFYQPDQPGEHRDANGNAIGFLFTGSVKDPARVSAVFCLRLAAKFGEPLGAPTVSINADRQSRVNVGHVTDNSRNFYVQGDRNVFAEMRGALENAGADERTAEVVRRIDALEAAAGSPTYFDRYNDFMQAAANHMTVLAPFLPALAPILLHALSGG